MILFFLPTLHEFHSQSKLIDHYCNWFQFPLILKLYLLYFFRWFEVWPMIGVWMIQRDLWLVETYLTRILGGQTLHVLDMGIVSMILSPGHSRLRRTGTFKLGLWSLFWSPALLILKIYVPLKIQYGGGVLDGVALKITFDKFDLPRIEKKIHGCNISRLSWDGDPTVDITFWIDK